MTSTWFSADTLLSETNVQERMAIEVCGGKIIQLLPAAEIPAGSVVTHFADAAIIPGLVNTHTHSFQSLLKGFCDDEDFFTWRDQALYKFSKIMSQDDLYHGALFAFGEMLKNGVTTVCDFFYINDQGVDNAITIAKAARDLGMRFVMARTMYDWDGAPLRFRETVDQAVANTRALYDHFKDDSMVSVLPAPHSLHGASVEMIQAGAELAANLGTMWHMHIAEGEYERQMILEKHGASPIRFLNREGLLTDKTVGIHCVWLDDEEVAMMGDTGAKVSYNPSSNMFLGDGITRIRELLDAGVCIGLGTDGGCSNNRASIIEEMRMTNLLQKVKFCDATKSKAEDAFLMGTVNGGKLLGQALGTLSPGAPADFVVVNLNDLSLQPRPFLLKNLVYSAMPSALSAVYVAGERIMQDGALVKFPESEIVARVQKTLNQWMS